MKVALTGATGFIGSHVLADLHEHGHEVTVLVRDDTQADSVAARGATPAVVDIHDRSAVTKLLGRANGAIHTASPGDATSANLDSAVVDAPPLVSWKVPIERRVLDATGMRGVVIVSGVAYGDGGGGIPGLLLGSPRDESGRLIMLGTGQQHWPTVHAADLADFFRRALEDDSARGLILWGEGELHGECGAGPGRAVEGQVRRWLRRGGGRSGGALP